MANRGGIFVTDGIGPVIAFMAANVVQNVADAMQDGKAQVESFAQSNAPWSDITGRARRGLKANISIEDGEIILELAHTEEYGYWLELIQDGRFAIIMPTLEALGPEIIRQAGGVVTATGTSF